MKACGLTRLNMTDEDRATLEGLIEMRLGNSALQMTRHRLTTDKNESINRSFSASLPKNVKFSRNAHGQGEFSDRSHKLWSGEFNAVQVGECILSYYER